MAKIVQQSDSAALWHAFATAYNLTPAQVDQFMLYAKLLSAWSTRMNLTAIMGLYDTIEYHFKDSLALRDLIAIKSIDRIVDVGTGAGFPGIALAIVYPHLKVTLIEVNAKKIQFLDTVIGEFGLSDRVEIYDQDWRSFLRMPGNHEKTLFCARASLQPEELCRIFKGGSAYKDAALVYWAAAGWEPEEKIAALVKKEVRYRVGDRERKLVLFGL